jgi:putative membrane protein
LGGNEAALGITVAVKQMMDQSHARTPLCVGGTASADERSIVVDQNDRETVSRNDLAEDRTILASERTFAGWMRTSMAAIAIGVGFHALFGRIEPGWLPRAIATGFLVLAIGLVVMAERRAEAVLSRMSTHVVKSSRRMNLRLLAIAISVGSVAVVAAIWMI